LGRPRVVRCHFVRPPLPTSSGSLVATRRRLRAVGGGADGEVVVRHGQGRLVKEGIGHAHIVVLAGVDQDLGMLAAQRGADGGELTALAGARRRPR
jgi:hypothetical protein